MDAFPADADKSTASNRLLNLQKTIVDQGEHVRVAVPKFVSFCQRQFAFVTTALTNLGMMCGAFIICAGANAIRCKARRAAGTVAYKLVTKLTCGFE